MNSYPHDFEDLRGRLLSLETQNRQFKQLGVAALIVAASVVVMGQASLRKTVEANEFILRDNSGNARARFGMDEKNFSAAQLVLYDEKGGERVKIDSGAGALPFGGTVRLSDEHGLTRVYLSSSSMVGGTLSLLDHKGVPGTVLHTGWAELPDVTVGVATTARLALAAKDKEARGLLYVDGDNAARLSLKGADDRKSLRLGPTWVAFGDTPKAIFYPGGLYVNDEEGFPANLGVSHLATPRTGEAHRTSAASLVLFDKDKNVIWKAP